MTPVSRNCKRSSANAKCELIYTNTYALTVVQLVKQSLEEDALQLEGTLYCNESNLNVKYINIRYETNSTGQLHLHCTMLSQVPIKKIKHTNQQRYQLDKITSKADLTKWIAYCNKEADVHKYKTDYLQRNYDMFTMQKLNTMKKKRKRKPH